VNEHTQQRENGRRPRRIDLPARWREFLAIVLAVLAVLLALALVTHHKDDVDRLVAGQPCGNRAGAVGAVVSYWLFQALGISVFAFPVLLGVLAVFSFMRAKFPSTLSLAVRSAALLCLAIACACVADIAHPLRLGCYNLCSAGGFIGHALNEYLLRTYCGSMGALVILVGVSLCCILLLFDTTLQRVWWFISLMAKLWRHLARAVVYVLAGIGCAVCHAGAVVVWCGAAVARLFASRRRQKQADIVIVGADAARKQREARRRARKEAKEEEATLVTPVVEPVPVPDDEPEPEQAEPAQPVEPAVAPPAEPAPLPPQPAVEPEPEQAEELPPYQKPGVTLLDEPRIEGTAELEAEAKESIRKLEETFKQFDIEATVGKAICGPVITCYEVHPSPGVKVNRITSLENDLALAMKAKSIRIVAPIPGRDAIGIELPNATRRIVTFAQLIHADEFEKAKRKMVIPLALGQTLSGEAFIDDLADMPHLLVAGATGSGKSVCINTILLSVLFRFEPHELKLVLVDPKHVELVPYKESPHLLMPVLNDPTKVPDALDWLIEEMEKRYKYFSRIGVRNIGAYNAKRQADPQPASVMHNNIECDLPLYLPYIVIVIDELADLMMVAGDEIERKIIRLAQLARAAGIHMVLATQRPSTNVITGLIKANIPARIAFRTASRVDSQVIIDEPGSEKLLGKGDMLFVSSTAACTMRVQGAFVSDQEIRRVTTFVRDQRAPSYVEIGLPKTGDGFGDIEMDGRFDEAVMAVLESGQASASYLQRRIQVGYARAARLIDIMEAQGIVGPKRGAKPRDILVEKWPPDTAN